VYPYCCLVGDTPGEVACIVGLIFSSRFE